MSNLAMTLRALGDAAGGRDLLLQAVHAYEQLLGPEHPNTLVSLHNLAGALVDLGDLAGARDLLQQAADAYRRLLGPEHPSTQTVTKNLIWVQHALAEPAP
jgi:hypothetical protein